MATPTKKSTPVKKSMKKSTSSKEDRSMLEEFVLDELKDIYWAEKNFTKVLPKMMKAATTSELKGAFEDHLNVTQTHITRLEQAFDLLGKKPQAKKCDAMAGITKEGESIIEDTEKGTMTRDAGLILAAQKVEHYEIATYGTLVQFAKTLGNTKLADLLLQTLNEEKDADETLTSIAESNINIEASEEEE